MRKVLNSGKVYDESDKKALFEFLENGSEMPFGKEYTDFEKAMAEYTHTKHAFFVNSGSSANILALSILTSYDLEGHLEPGDEVITIAASFPTTVFPIVQVGCVPVFVDIELDTLNIDTTKLELALSDRTRAVMVANSLGNPMALDIIEKFCILHNLFFINDCCDALGSMYKGEPVFTYGDVSTLSTYAAHHIFTGNGGVVFTNNDRLAHLIRSYRSWGRGSCTCDLGQDNKCGKRFASQHGGLPFGFDHKNTFQHFGYNLMASNMQAALGLSQIKRADIFKQTRQRNFRYLYDKITNSHIADKFILLKSLPDSDVSYFGFPLIVKNNERHGLTVFLEGKGVQTRYLFAGNIIKQPCFHDNPHVKFRVVGDLPNTDRIMNDLVWVGCYHGLDLEDMDYIFDTLCSFWEALHESS